MSNFKLTKIICVSLISLQSMTAFSFEMTEPELRESIRRYLSIYYNVDENIVDQFIIEPFVELVNRHSDLFNHLAEIETYPEFLPYVEKYSDLKVKFTGQPINADIKVVFSNNPINNNNNKFIGACDPLTRIIFIDRSLWSQYSETFKEAIFSHAMGLCDLNREKIYAISSANTILSFMNTYLLNLLFLPDSPERLHINSITKARENLDETFETMYQELFSRENTRENLCGDTPICVNIHLWHFENEVFSAFGIGIPGLKHMTIDSALE